MAVKSIGSSWQTNLRTGSPVSRDYRLYFDPRGFEFPDLGTGSAQYTVAREDNLIDRGNCELGIGPYIFDETIPNLVNATFDRSTDFAHTGDSSYKMIDVAGGLSRVFLQDNITTTDMHGYVSGSTYEITIWVYIPTASGLGVSEFLLVSQFHNGAVWSGGEVSNAVTTLDTWEKLTLTTTVQDEATGYRVFLQIAGAAAGEYIHCDDFKITTHNVPGSHFLSGGFIETLNELPDTFTLQIKFKPNFAFDTGTAQNLFSWRVSPAQFFIVNYTAATDKFTVSWVDGGTTRTLISAQYDDGSAQRNINQFITMTVAIDLTTGSVSGSSLWLDKTQDDTTWNAGAIDAKTTVFNKMQIRANNGTTGDFDIAYLRMFRDFVATDAQVQNDFKDVKAEEIYWSLDGHGTGRTRTNITSFKTANNSYKGVTSKSNASQGTNLFDFTLNNLNGEFSDDQNAAYDPANSVYNGTNAQNYLQRRFGVMYETWFSGDFDTIFSGRVTESGLARSTANLNFGTVRASAEDGIGDIDRSVERFGRVFEDLMLVRSDTLIDRGSCESKIPASGVANVNQAPPSMIGEISDTLTNATFARDRTEIFRGRFAYKATVSVGGSVSDITLADSEGAGDTHGMVAGNTYKLKAKVFIPSGALTPSELTFGIVDSVGTTTTAAVNTTDAWQEISVERTLDGGATFAYPRLRVAASATSSEIYYIDDIELIPTSKSEATNNSLFHNIAGRADRRQIQYLSNNSFENATIGNSWSISAGGTLNRDGADGFFGSASGELIPGAASEQVSQIVNFTGTKKLNVGDTYNFSIFLKSTAAASGVNNEIGITGRDASGSNNATTQSYSLDGGEGYKKFDISHTITDSDTDRLQVIIDSTAGDTINIDGAMLIQADRPLDYFKVNALDGTASVSLADLGPEVSWEWFGINAGNADYIHPWRRMEAGTTVWQNVKSIGSSLASFYLGMDEAGTLSLMATLDKDFEPHVIEDVLTQDDFRQNIQVVLDALMGNKFIGVGVRIVKDDFERLIFQASGAGNFNISSGDQQLTEPVAANAFWPDPETYGEYWAEYGVTNKDIAVNRELTVIPQTVSYYSLAGGTGGAFQIAKQVVNPNIFKKTTITKSDNIAGIKDADLIGKLTDTGDGNWAVTEVTSGKLINGLDVTSREGQARILIQNGASPIVIVECGIVGKPVYKFTGGEGYIHDDFVDYDSISKNGELLIEFGGEDVIDGSANGQLDRLADFFWKDRSERKHIYHIEFPGTAYDISPGARYRITAGSAGNIENIDSTVEVQSVRTQHDWQTNAVGRTKVILREVQENWKPDSNAIARFRARGVPLNNPSTGAVVTIGSEFYTGTTDYRVPIGSISAETFINDAIDFLSGSFGGGIIKLTKGTFKTDGSIRPKSNIIIQGDGPRTIIERNYNGQTINATGGPGSELTGIQIRDFTITRDAAFTNTHTHAVFTFCDDLKIINVAIDDSTDHGIEIVDSDRFTVSGCLFTSNGTTIADRSMQLQRVTDFFIINNNFVSNVGSAILIVTSGSGTIGDNAINGDGNSAIVISGGTETRVVNNYIQSITGDGISIDDLQRIIVSGNTIVDGSADGIETDNVDDSTISDNIIFNNSGDGIKLDNDSDDNNIENNVTRTNGGTGILINNANCDNNSVDGNVSKGNTAAEFTDNGTGTKVG